MINLGNIEIADLRLGASQVKALCLGSEQIWSGEEPAPVAGPWLCFTAEEANCTVNFNKIGTSVPEISIEYSYDGSSWTDYSWTDNNGDTLTLANVGDKVYMRANNENTNLARNQNANHRFSLNGTIAASGNIQTLLKADGSRTDVPSYCYAYLFSSCVTLTTAPYLPATTVADYCYYSMFSGCTSLTQAPVLPATTLAYRCYSDMFYNCRRLTSIDVSFTAWNPTNATSDWVNGAGSEVTGTKTFTCPAELPDTRGTSNIPEGWTKADAA